MKKYIAQYFAFWFAILIKIALGIGFQKLMKNKHLEKYSEKTSFYLILGFVFFNIKYFLENWI